MDDQDETIETILRRLDRLGASGHVAVVGLSDKPERPSNEVAAYLIRQGFQVSPVNPVLETVFGLRCHPALEAVPGPVDVVDVFRRSEEAGAIVDEAIAIGAWAVWLQEGVVDEAAGFRARQAGLLVVMDRCILKEHARRAR